VQSGFGYPAVPHPASRDERVGTAVPLFAAFTEAIMDHPRFADARFPDLCNILTTGSRAAVRVPSGRSPRPD